MDKFDMLLIRACKSTDSITRLKSLYRRFYLRGNYREDVIADKLLKIVSDHNLSSMNKIVMEYLSPDNYWKFGGKPNDPYYHIVTLVCSSIIRNSPLSKLPDDYIKPIRWRKQFDN